MDLTVAIQHILDGNAVIIMGSGASWGAKNAFGQFPSGATLAKHLYEACGIEADDKKDLQDAAQSYEEKFSAEDLIREVRTQLTCSSVLPCHSTIYSQPWMRYYTTNYDNVALIAAQQKGVKITPISLGASFRKYHEYKRLCVHINGHIDNLNEITLHNEFKLTASSYLSQDNIMNSDWGMLMANDLEAAKCVVILGLSLQYDLDLSRIIYNAEGREKTIIISSTNTSPNAESKYRRFGTVFKIGVQGFADKIEEIHARYTPQVMSPIDKVYSCFDHEYRMPLPVEKASPKHVYDLFLCGNYNRRIFHKTNGNYDGFVFRSKFVSVQKALLDGIKYIFVHADMGNGKTACIEELKYVLSKYEYHVFSLSKTNLTNLSEEIRSICAIESPCVVIIDNYTSYMEVLKAFSVNSHTHIQFVFTARSALNYSKMQDVFDVFSIREGESTAIGVDTLGGADIQRCVSLFDRAGAWGARSGLSATEKADCLRDRNHGNSRFQTIMLDVIQSDDMSKRIKRLVGAIKNDSLNYHNAVLLILITRMMNLRLSASDIERIAGQSITSDAVFRTNSAICELLEFSDGKKSFIIKSPVTAKFILHEVSEPQMIIDALFVLAQYAVKYQHVYQYSSVLNDIISFSHISSVLNPSRDNKAFLASYYDRLGEIEYYRSSNFFWLQYAISCIEIGEYSRAQRYLNDAYGLVPKDFVPFQINNQQARLCLELIMSAKSSNALNDYRKAHQLLMLPITSAKDNEYNVVRLFGYYIRKDFVARMNSDELREFHAIACKDAYNRLAAYLNRHPEHNEHFYELRKKLLTASVI